VHCCSSCLGMRAGSVVVGSLVCSWAVHKRAWRPYEGMAVKLALPSAAGCTSQSLVSNQA
jgi:hypothetical protein